MCGKCSQLAPELMNFERLEDELKEDDEVTKLPTTVRAAYVLKLAGAKTLRDVCNLPDHAYDLSRIKGCGHRTLVEIHHFKQELRRIWNKLEPPADDIGDDDRSATDSGLPKEIQEVLERAQELSDTMFDLHEAEQKLRAVDRAKFSTAQDVAEAQADLFDCKSNNLRATSELLVAVDKYRSLAGIRAMFQTKQSGEDDE